MVSFEIVKNTDSKAIYHYYPNGDKDKGYGVIELEKKSGYLHIPYFAPQEIVSTISAEEMNSLRESANTMRLEEGRPTLTEEEWPIAKTSEIKTFYGDHAIKKIAEEFKRGRILERGRIVWF